MLGFLFFLYSFHLSDQDNATALPSLLLAMLVD
jgi:hypothetical protein